MIDKQRCTSQWYILINAKRQNGCPRRAYKQLRKEEKQKAKEERKDTPSECRVPKKTKER